MNCHPFNVVSFESIGQGIGDVMNRAGMAVAYHTSSKGTKAYFVGGYNPTTKIALGTVNVADIHNTLPVMDLAKGPDMIGILPRKFHTATWIDAPLNGIVMMGGQTGNIVTQPLTPVAVYDSLTSNWTNV